MRNSFAPPQIRLLFLRDICITIHGAIVGIEGKMEFFICRPEFRTGVQTPKNGHNKILHAIHAISMLYVCLLRDGLKPQGLSIQHTVFFINKPVGVKRL